MWTCMAELKYKEIVSIADGGRFGFVGDMEIDLQNGKIHALLVPGRLRMFGLLGREEARRIPWESIRQFGEDIILIDDPEQSVNGKNRTENL